MNGSAIFKWIDFGAIHVSVIQIKVWFSFSREFYETITQGSYSLGFPAFVSMMYYAHTMFSKSTLHFFFQPCFRPLSLKKNKCFRKSIDNGIVLLLSGFNKVIYALHLMISLEIHFTSFKRINRVRVSAALFDRLSAFNY